MAQEEEGDTEDDLQDYIIAIYDKTRTHWYISRDIEPEPNGIKEERQNVDRSVRWSGHKRKLLIHLRDKQNKKLLSGGQVQSQPGSGRREKRIVYLIIVLVLYLSHILEALVSSITKASWSS